VRTYLRGFAKSPDCGPRAARPSKLNAFKPYLHERIEAAKPYWTPTTVLFREVQTQGYDGQEGLVKISIRQFKPITKEPVVRFGTAPGKQMQVDFTTIKRGRKKLKGFVATLGFSRAFYVVFSEYEKQ